MTIGVVTVLLGCIAFLLRFLWALAREQNTKPRFVKAQLMHDPEYGTTHLLPSTRVKLRLVHSRELANHIKQGEEFARQIRLG